MMQNKVIGIISKPPSSRTDTEIRVVLPWLRKKSELLSSGKDDVLLDVVRNCDYRRAYNDDVIVTQGDRGECFYIMLSGKTSVYIDTTKSDDDVDPTKAAVGNVGAGDVGNVTADDDDDEDDDDLLSHGGEKKKKPLDRSKYGKFIIHFEAGKSFGEIALISDDSVRNATVIADEETDMLLIHRDLFNRSMKAEQEKEYEERKSFIANCRLFSDWNPKFKHLLEMSLRKVVYPFGARIMKQGDPVDGLFFIVSGQAKVTAEPSRHHQQYPGLTTKVSLLEQEFGRQNKENQVRKLPNGLTQHQIRVRRKEGYAAAERRYMSRAVDICCVEGNEIQGDLETVMELSTNACTVTCTADTTVFILDSKNYERLILKKNVHSITRLKQGVMKKLHSRLVTSVGGHVPILQIIHDKLKDELQPKVKTTSKKEGTDNDKNNVLQQMIKLYMKDKTPMIDPMLPDSFYNRLMAEKRNKQIERRDKKKEELAVNVGQKRRKVPRSLKQLQNSAAETELMHPSRPWLDNGRPSRDTHIRPRTALGIESSVSVERNHGVRPETAGAKTSGVFYLTECETVEEMGQTIAKEKPVAVTEQFDQVFQHMDNIQREKSEARSRVICSTAAKSEVRSETERAHLGYQADDMYDMHDEDYFDYETSATNLKHLEERIKSFCHTVTKRRNSDPFRVSEMRSYQVKGSDHVPMSGGTVYVNRKPCIYPRNARVTADIHQHVRRFMISRDQGRSSSSATSMTRSKSAIGLVSKRPKSAW